MKKLIMAVLAFSINSFSYAQVHGIINDSNSPYMPIKSINFNDCRWTSGFWADKQNECVRVMVPNLGRWMEDPDIAHAYENFLVAAGLKKGEFKGWSFSDGDFYKYVEALTYAYGLTKDKKIDQHLDEIINVIGKAQCKDGYIHTMIQIGHGVTAFHHQMERTFEHKNKPFQRAGDHELYNFGHLMTAACIHYRITGKTNFLDIARKAADMLYAKFHNPSSELAALAWNPPHIMGLVEMYRTTGDKKYLELAQTFVNMRGTSKGTNLDQSQKRIPIRQETEAVGHAVFANYLYAGIADVYAETGDTSLLDAIERIWKDVVYKKMYITGATGALHFGVSSHHDLVSEAYGSNYELPNIDSYNETCANIANAMWNWRMFLITGKARFMDVVELVFYNSALSGISLDGKHYFYTNPLGYLRGDPNDSKDDGKRSTSLSVYCCPPNIIRTIAKINTYAYTTSEKGVWVNLYGSNVLNTRLADGSNLKLTQQTDYPWNGLVKITLDEVSDGKAFSLMLRIPGWANGVTLTVNGKIVQGQLKPASYFELNRKWKVGDVIELNMPMKAQLVKANPFVEADRGRVAVKRGPLVYCLESVDLPKSAVITDVEIPQDINLKPQFEKNLLSGVTVLEGEAEFVKQGDWSNQLYKPLTPQRPEKFKLRLIPYFAWSNRGATDMSVWLRLGY